MSDLFRTAELPQPGDVTVDVTRTLCCKYELKWRSSWVGVLAGGVVGGAAAHFGWQLQIPLVVSVAIAGGLLGAWIDVLKLTRAQGRGLERLVEDLQRRNEEIEKVNQQLSETNDKLEKSLSAQKEVDALKTEFVQNINHELRTPLTLILLSLDALSRQDELHARARDHLVAMNRSASRLLKLIDNLLDLSKLNLGKARLNYQPLALDEFLKALVLPFTAFARDKGITISVEGSAQTQVVADAELLDRVFQNLLANAVKFTPSGQIRLKLSETEDQVRVEVSDTGIGITAEELPSLFDRFSSADSQSILRTGGARRGMALTRQIVELQGGMISAASEPGKGTVFLVTLPKGVAHVDESLRERRQLPRMEHPRVVDGATVEPSQIPPSAKPEHPLRTILLVEDEAEQRSFVVRLLKPHYRVIEARDGEEGLQRAREERPDLVLSDVMMPERSGTQLTEALRASPDTADLPVILLTSLRGNEDRLAGFQVGANDYLAKPFSPAELLARIETQLKLRDAAATLASNDRLATLGLLSSGFAHEVRNPLNAILNVLAPMREALGPNPDLETARSFIDLVEECGQRVRHLSETLLAFARPGTRRDVVDVRTGLEATLRVLSWKTTKDVTVNREYVSEDWVTGDAGALNQVWLNLLDNAMRAVQHKGELTIRTETRGTELCVSVIDSGTGIKPEDLKRLFQPFFSTRPAGEGTGLGLALCRRIVAAHGGHIEVKSEVGVGTRFVVHLPLPQRPSLEEPHRASA